MLKATLDAVARLEYPNFECVVVINNTPDPAYWRPIEEHCRTLGERFKFVNADNLAGYKAGALRLALAHTAPDAEIIGVIDADYVVQADWLKDLVPAFADPQVGMVQAPQDHRDGDRTLMHHAMNGEYAGFFDIGMVQRNEANAIIVHGTMCLIRRAALEAAGGWSSDTICEDTDLGLTMLEHGWQIHYTNRRYGHGLLPDTFEAYKKQRHRWAYGGFQILAQALAPAAAARARGSRASRSASSGSAGSTGWARKRIGVAVAILNLVWVPVVAFADIAVPDKILTLPILAAFVVSLAALRRALSAARGDPGRADGRRGASPPCRCSGRWRARSASASWTESAAVHAHRQGRHDPQGPRLPGVLGRRAGGAAVDRRRPGGDHQLQADPRDQHVRRGAGGAEPAVPGRRRASP